MADSIIRPIAMPNDPRYENQERKNTTSGINIPCPENELKSRCACGDNPITPSPGQGDEQRKNQPGKKGNFEADTVE